MKKIQLFFFAVLVGICLTACHKATVLQIAPETIEQSLDGGSGEATISTDAEKVKVLSAPEWCTVIIEKVGEAAYRLHYTMEPAPNGGDRKGTIKIAADQMEREIAVVQTVPVDDNVCPRCNGTGRMICDKCFGFGTTESNVVVEAGCRKCGGSGEGGGTAFSNMVGELKAGAGHIACSLCHGTGTKDGTPGPNVLKAGDCHVALESYTGHIGPYGITMHFDNHINGGYYSYNERPNANFCLVTEKCETRGNIKKMLIQEYTSKGTNSGHFEGTFDASKGHFEGTFTNSQGQSYPFELKK